VSTSYASEPISHESTNVHELATSSKSPIPYELALIDESTLVKQRVSRAKRAKEAERTKVHVRAPACRSESISWRAPSTQTEPRFNISLIEGERAMPLKGTRNGKRATYLHSNMAAERVIPQESTRNGQRDTISESTQKADRAPNSEGIKTGKRVNLVERTLRTERVNYGESTTP
jgi:hypothetical protein